MLNYSIPQAPTTGQARTLPSYHGPPDPQLEKLADRSYTRGRSRLVDRWVEYADQEGF